MMATMPYSSPYLGRVKTPYEEALNKALQNRLTPGVTGPSPPPIPGVYQVPESGFTPYGDHLGPGKEYPTPGFRESYWADPEKQTQFPSYPALEAVKQNVSPLRLPQGYGPGANWWNGMGGGIDWGAWVEMLKQYLAQQQGGGQ